MSEFVGVLWIVEGRGPRDRQWFPMRDTVPFYSEEEAQRTVKLLQSEMASSKYRASRYQRAP
jgi:hypothetical protein